MGSLISFRNLKSHLYNFHTAVHLRAKFVFEKISSPCMRIPIQYYHSSLQCIDTLSVHASSTNKSTVRTARQLYPCHCAFLPPSLSNYKISRFRHAASPTTCICPLSLLCLCIPCCPSLLLNPSRKACSALVCLVCLRCRRVVVHFCHRLGAHSVVRVLHVTAGVVSDMCVT